MYVAKSYVQLQKLASQLWLTKVIHPEVNTQVKQH